jgi:hypothetical protein
MLGSTRVKSAVGISFIFPLASVTILSLWLATLTLAQNNAGSIPFSSVAKDQYDTIDLSNLNILLDVPVRRKTGAIAFNYKVAGYLGLSFARQNSVAWSYSAFGKGDHDQSM